jgi:uroporphyrinogen-III synthase
MEHLLSTKTLNLAQKQLLLDAKMEFSEYDAISIKLVPFKSPNFIQNAIFSSQNAVKSMKKYQKELLFGNIENCFCVGEKTTALLKENNQKVIKISQNASELANFIKKTYKNEDFYFFCGSHRRDELPEILKKSKNPLFEVKTYEIELNSIHFEQKLDKILFFSPSGVQSFTSENQIGNSQVICIGETTASEAKKHTDNVIIASETTIDSVINEAIKTH